MKTADHDSISLSRRFSFHHEGDLTPELVAFFQAANHLIFGQNIVKNQSSFLVDTWFSIRTSILCYVASTRSIIEYSTSCTESHISFWKQRRVRGPSLAPPRGQNRLRPRSGGGGDNDFIIISVIIGGERGRINMVGPSVGRRRNHLPILRRERRDFDEGELINSALSLSLSLSLR